MHRKTHNVALDRYKTTRPHDFDLYDLTDAVHSSALHVRHEGEPKEFRMHLHRGIGMTMNELVHNLKTAAMSDTVAVEEATSAGDDISYIFQVLV